MTWTFDKFESSYSAEFPQGAVRIIVEGDDFAKDDKGAEIPSCEYLPLKEGNYYHFELSDRRCRLSQKSSFIHKPASHGSIAPGTAVGYGRLYLEGAESPELSLGIEVASEVISYKKDYQELLQQLTEDIADLQMQCTSSVQGLVGVNERTAAKNDVQQLFFLLGLVGNAGFDAALRQIVERPQVQLVEVEYDTDIRQASRIGRNELRQFASASRRVDLPVELKGRYSSLTTAPERIVATRRIESIDTHENQFVKYVLNTFLERLQAFKRTLQEKRKDESALAVMVDLDAGIKMLSRWTAHEFFKGVGQLLRMPTASVVLQRREGYREVLKKWLQLQAGATLKTELSKDIYAANQRKMSALYEYWCFFRLLKIVCAVFGISTPQIAEKMIGRGADGLSLKLKEGQSVTFDGTFDSGRKGVRFRSLAVEFSYNRTFSAKGKDMSWTLPMRPDYTVAFRPLGMNLEDALKYDLVTYVHFDAKYKARDLSASLEQIGKENPVETNDADEGDDAQTKRDVKRVDILKMHAYRDAIRKTGGAYVLYPGTEQNIHRENGEIIPGLGAFTLSPSNDSSEKIKKFLADVARHLCDRVTRWENYTYQTFRIYSRGKAEFQADNERAEKLLIEGYDEPEVREERRVNLDAVTDERYLDPDRYFSVVLDQAEISLKWAYEHNVFILKEKEWNKLGKPNPALITLISVAWRPPINLLVQRFINKMPARQILATYPSCPFTFTKRAELDEEYQVWEVRAIDTKTLETRLANTARKGQIASRES